MYIATILIIHLSIRDKKVVLKLNILSFWSVWGCSVFSYLHHVALRPPTRAMRFDDFLKVATLGFKCPSRMYDLYTLIKYSIDIFVIGISLCRGGGGVHYIAGEDVRKRHRARKLQCSPGRVKWPIQRQTTLKIYYLQQPTTNYGMIHTESVFWGWMWIEALRWTLPYILNAVCSTQDLNRYEQMIQFDTFPFQKHQVIRQQHSSLSSVTKVPHCEYKKTTTETASSVKRKYFCE